MDGEPSSVAVAAEAAGPVPTGRSELIRIIWALAWPVIVTFALESFVGLIDTLMVGRLGASAVAGVGVGAQVLSAVSVAMTAVGTGTLALVARHFGARETEEADQALLQSILAAAVLSAFVVIPVIVWASALVRAFGVEASVVADGAPYIRVVMLSIPASAILFVIASGLRGAGDTRTPLVIGLVVNVLNVIGNYILIFGKLGAPALGVVGAAAATTGSFCVGAALGIGLLARGKLLLGLPWRRARPRFAVIRRVLAIGYPTAAEQMLMQVGFFIYLVFAARYGTSAVAAYFIGVRILALSFLPGFGFGAAASTLVGQNLGAQRPDLAERSGWESNRLAIYLMTVAGAAIFLAARPIAAVFIDDPAVIADTVSFIRVLAAAQPLMAIDFTLGGALRGAGDTRFPLIAVLVGFYGCRLGFAYVVAFWLHLSLFWVWFALVGDYLARVVLKGYRFRSGVWKLIKV